MAFSGVFVPSFLPAFDRGGVASVVATSGMILHFDVANGASYPGSGATVYDIAGAGAPNGVFQTSPPLAAGTPIAFMMETNYFVKTTEKAVLRPLNLTLEWWGYLVSGTKTTPPWGNPVTQNSELISYAISSSPYYAYSLLHTSNNNTVAGQITVGSSLHFVAAVALSKPEWCQLALTYDGETLRLYRNGYEVAQNTTPSGNIAWTSYSHWNIGTWEDNGIGTAYSETNYYGNKWSIVRQYNRALSAAEILSNFNAQRSRFSI